MAFRGRGRGRWTPDQGTPSKYYFDGSPVRGDGGGGRGRREPDLHWGRQVRVTEWWGRLFRLCSFHFPTGGGVWDRMRVSDSSPPPPAAAARARKRPVACDEATRGRFVAGLRRGLPAARAAAEAGCTM